MRTRVWVHAGATRPRPPGRPTVDAHRGRVNQSASRLARRATAGLFFAHLGSFGDGVLATFDGPARAVRAAGALRDRLARIGIETRAGLHTGECEIIGDDLGGIAMSIGARVSALAGSGEILVSSTVKDLVAGSGIEFIERGEHMLNGVPGEWRVFAVKSL